MPHLCSQLCLAYRNDRGRVIVVLSQVWLSLLTAGFHLPITVKEVVCMDVTWNTFWQVPKTEMEETFRFVIPEADRYNSTFVFRCAPTATCYSESHAVSLQHAGSILMADAPLLISFPTN